MNFPKRVHKKLALIILLLFYIIPSFSWAGNTRKPSVDIDKLMTHLNGKKFALVVGIDTYPTMPLEAAVNDANAVSQRLSELNFQVTTLLDHKATLKNIRHELGTKLALSKPQDQVVIYFAGHGVTEKLHGNKVVGYILPVDVNVKDLYSTAISMKELRALTARIPARHILFAFDSCYSGLGLSRSAVYSGKKQNLQNYLERISGKRAVYMVTAGKASEVAREYQGHGLFTLHFLDAIAGAADTSPKDGIVQASELGRYVAQKVTMETENEQNPQYGLIEGDGDFLFPLMDDDPIRLRESTLSRLQDNAIVLSRRKSIQESFEKETQALIASEKTFRDDYDKKIHQLDDQIRLMQDEVEEIRRNISVPNGGDVTREQYNVMKFLNTGVEIDIQQTYPDVKSAEKFFASAMGYHGRKEFKLINTERSVPSAIRDKLKQENTYPTKIDSYTRYDRNQHWLQKLISINFYDKEISKGLIDRISVTVVTPPVILAYISEIQSPLKDDTTTFISEIVYDLCDISGNDKLLLFDQFANRMISRYGRPTSFGKTIRLKNWKTGNYSKYKEMKWEDEKTSILLTKSGSSIDATTIKIIIQNKNPIIDTIWQQALRICEAEQLFLLKKRIQAMADIERSKTAKVKSIEF